MKKVFKHSFRNTSQSYIMKEKIYIMDGIAIISIVLYHALPRYNMYFNNGSFDLLHNYIGILGLILFTFSSGFKLGLNHHLEINDKLFIKNYCIKRFIRLYKPYWGYSALIFMPLYISIMISNSLLRTKYEFFNGDFLDLLFQLIIGNNILANHLWYLLSLIIITAFCFIIIYLTNVKYLFKTLPFILIISFFFSESFSESFNIFSKTLGYLGEFIIGILYAYIFQNFSNLLKFQIKLFSIIFIISFCASAYYTRNPSIEYAVALFGFTVPCLILFLSEYILLENHLRGYFTYCGTNSFYIYLFHEPLIIPLINYLIIVRLGFNSPLIPFIVTFLTIAVSIKFYRLIKIIGLSKLIE